MTAFEFQRLHGMGEELYASPSAAATAVRACRAACTRRSASRDLLPYLVRRLLENGANTSFVNRIVDEQVAIDDLVARSAARARRGISTPRTAHSAAARHLTRPSGTNSAGV